MILTDSLNRPLRDLRISVTDRCNFRCVYCMPKEIFGSDYQFLPRAQILTFEEIARLARIFVRAWRSQDSVNRRRTAGTPRSALAGCHAGGYSGSRSDPDHQRFLACQASSTPQKRRIKTR